MADRKTVATALKKASCYYWLKKGYSCHEELGLLSRGVLKGDIVCVNLKAYFVVCETKSCVSDYTTDKKWKQYLDYCNKFYFVFTLETFEKLKDRLKTDLKDTGAGVMVLHPSTGWLVVKVNAKERNVAGAIRKTLLTRMAWRAGISKRTSRCYRVFIKETE